MSKDIIYYLKSKEWSLGNGQCPECYGHKPRHKWWTETVGHKTDCIFAKLLKKFKIQPIYERINHSKERYEMKRFWKETMSKIKEKTNDI